MGTSAIYTFKDADKSFHVYIHWDGYPTGAASYLATTLVSGLVWDLPRFEANEFTAGFVAANKTAQGGVRLLKSPRSVGDAEYAYTVTQKDGVLMLKAQSVDAWDTYKARTIWTGTLADFIATGAESLE